MSIRIRLGHIGSEALKRKFTPEFINRIDDIVTFHTLNKEQLSKVVTIELTKLQYILDRNLGKGIVKLSVLETAKEALLDEGYDPKYNARELKRVIQKRIQLPLSRIIASDQLVPKQRVYVQYDGKDYNFQALDLERMAEANDGALPS